MDDIGIDIYNGCVTGEVSKTINAGATDSDHLPCVVVRTPGQRRDMNDRVFNGGGHRNAN